MPRVRNCNCKWKSDAALNATQKKKKEIVYQIINNISEPLII